MQINKDKKTGIIGTMVVHIIVLLLLFAVFIHRPEAQEEGGVPVMLGNIDMAFGMADPYMLVDVNVLKPGMPNIESASANQEYNELDISGVDDLITQDEELTVEMPVNREKTIKSDSNHREMPLKKKDLSKQIENSRPVTKPKPEKTEARKEADTESVVTEAQEKVAAQQAAQKIAGAFGKGSKMGSTGAGKSGDGYQGSQTGNSNTGKTTGIGGYGTFDLNGRSLGQGGLPMPVYNVQDEGRVVVTITVNPGGQVIRTSINKRTNTVNEALREAALNAAKKARFNQIDGVNDQTGTITYYFKLK